MGPYATPFLLRSTIPLEGSALYNRYLDEYAMCDELGINLMFNEHHSTATCLSTICTIPLAIMARQTKRARLLALGMPLANRRDPLRIAEEYAMIDVISGGRVEMGFVKGSPQEVFPANSNPVDMMERFWEAHDLIVKAMSTHDGSFVWEGRHFNYRNVNLWPRPIQDPHPPIWVTGGSVASAQSIAAKGYVFATLNTGFAPTKTLFEAYRKAARPGLDTADKLAYLALLSLGDTKEEAFRRGDQVLDYVRNSGRVAPHYTNPPGYSPVAANVAAMRAGITGGLGSHQQVRSRSGERLIARQAHGREHDRCRRDVRRYARHGVQADRRVPQLCRRLQPPDVHVAGRLDVACRLGRQHPDVRQGSAAAHSGNRRMTILPEKPVCHYVEHTQTGADRGLPRARCGRQRARVRSRCGGHAARPLRRAPGELRQPPAHRRPSSRQPSGTHPDR